MINLNRHIIPAKTFITLKGMVPIKMAVFREPTVIFNVLKKKKIFQSLIRVKALTMVLKRNSHQRLNTECLL